MVEPHRFEQAVPAAIVVGAGPAGLVAAITLASAGMPTILAGQSPDDNRTTALLGGSVTALETLNVWPRCAASAAPLRVMRIVDDTGRLLRAPEVSFDSMEIGLEAFGQNIANRDLLLALAERAEELDTLTWIKRKVTAVKPGADAVIVHLETGESCGAPLVIAADGRHSTCREAAGIDVDTRRYRQSALTVCLSHRRPHHDISTEFHTEHGPFTLVPLPGSRSSLVWVMTPDAAETVAALSDDMLAKEIERRSHAILGTVTVEPGRGVFPLSAMRARVFGQNRIALVGEAAHVIPPIGAQGLNLGLRDAAVIAELAIDAWRHGRDAGGPALLESYDHRRQSDIGSRSLVIDVLNRSLLSDFLPAQGLRGLGLHMIDRIGPLRRALMREGIAPAANEPRLMRGEVL
jgi:2-octaprenyl-6-methoxyphenol hydroxylase